MVTLFSDPGEGAYWTEFIKRYLYDTLHFQTIRHAFVDILQVKDNRFNVVFQGRLVGIGNLEKSWEESPSHLLIDGFLWFNCR
jgi:hypothetical protein